MTTTEAINETHKLLDPIIRKHKRLAEEIATTAAKERRSVPKQVLMEFDSVNEQIDAAIFVKELLISISEESDVPRVVSEIKAKLKMEEARTNPWPDLSYLSVFRFFLYALDEYRSPIPMRKSY